jgi:hypothetical protein
MALIEHQGEETLWHDAFTAQLAAYSELWAYVDQYFKQQLNVTLPLDVLRKVVDDLIWDANDVVRNKNTHSDPARSDIAAVLREAASVFDTSEEVVT